MPDTTQSGVPDTEAEALDGISVAPPTPDDADAAATPKTDQADADAKLDHALEETFPGSDAPSTTLPGSTGEPAPSSGYDEASEPD